MHSHNIFQGSSAEQICKPSFETPSTSNSDDLPKLSKDSVSIDQLLNRISLLEAENEAWRGSQDMPIRSETVYFISGGKERRAELTAYLDKPTWTVGYHGEIVLNAHVPIPDVQVYIKQQPTIAFMIAKFYELEQQEREVQQAAPSKSKLPQPIPSSEIIRLESEDMVEAMRAYIDSKPNLKELFPDSNVRFTLPAPYLFWYHDRSPTAFDGLNELHQAHMVQLTAWIDANYGDIYDRVEKQLQGGVVSYEAVEFLIKPGDAIIVKDKSEQEGEIYIAEITTSWPRNTSPKRPFCLGMDMPWKIPGSEEKKSLIWTWEVESWAYRHNGLIHRQTSSIEVKIQAQKLDEEIPIRELNAYPLKYASDEVKSVLAQRGRTFWMCRDRKLVSYEDANGRYGVSFDVVNHWPGHKN
jgi:hypothetical protein